MRGEWFLALCTAAFLAIVGVIYWVWSGEVSGTVMLIFGCFAYGLMFVFMLLVFLRRKRIPRAEDKPDGTMEEGAGEVAFFPSNSIWPVSMGLGAVGLALGLAFGKWFWIIGGILMFGALIGFTVEAESR
ncbi:MAG TPA: cytochrome c oxidase subunit 4 [Acidimicrobiales bacterium]|nr:cytochrome c oxidase subunit 4 [Acidimicrobiales bacterium]